MLSTSYGNIVALDIEHLRVEPGSLAVLVGPNGAGKSTLLTLVSGLINPSTGLDATSRAALIAALASLTETGKTILCSTHEVELIKAADNPIRLDSGRLEQP